MKESHVKQFECIRELSFMNVKTMADLAVRLQESREPAAILSLYYLNSLASSLKEADVMNQTCFQELANTNGTKRDRDNADYKFARFWNTNGTQMEQLKQNSGLMQLSHFESAVASFLYELREHEYQIDKVRAETITAVHETASSLGENVPQLIRSSYVVFDKLLRMKMEGNGDDAKSAEELLGTMQTIVSDSIQRGGVAPAFLLSQLSQIAHHTLVWIEMILPKNKKCSKPMPAKEPVGVADGGDE